MEQAIQPQTPVVPKPTDDLKDEIYNIAKQNIETAKNLYNSLTTKNNNETLDPNLVIINSEQAVNCLKTIRENTDTLIKLYSEINKKESQGKTTSVPNEIYALLDSVTIDPFAGRNQIN